MPNVVPTVCPYCKKHISPVEKMWGEHWIRWKWDDRYFLYQCTNKECEKCFVALYRQESHNLSYRYIPIPSNQKEEFSNVIMGISSNFEIIYNQSYSAEQDWLLQICWGGYRKALEFLIKDLKVKGSSMVAKQGTAVRNIRLDHENAEYIEGRVDGQTIVIITQYVKKI